MKPHISNRNNQALTITEVLVVVATFSLLAAVALAQAINSAADSQKIACVNNLKQIGLAYRIWEGNHSMKYPMQVPVNRHGAMEPATRGNVALVFQVMSNVLSTPKTLVCPADTGRSPAKFFTTGFDNSHISYFVGLDAIDRFPRRLLSGDSNLAVDGSPAKPGLLEIVASQSITWTAERHVNQGNIGLADGSVQTASSSYLSQMLVQTGLATNRLALP